LITRIPWFSQPAATFGAQVGCAALEQADSIANRATPIIKRASKLIDIRPVVAEVS
jgi:hypothetical protein